MREQKGTAIFASKLRNARNNTTKDSRPAQIEDTLKIESQCHTGKVALSLTESHTYPCGARVRFAVRVLGGKNESLMITIPELLISDFFHRPCVYSVLSNVVIYTF